MPAARLKTETLGERIDFLMRHSGGTMPIAMVVKSEDEAAAARALLATKRGKAAKLISVKVDDAPTELGA